MSPEIQQYLKDTLTSWATQFVRDRVDYLRRRRISASAALEQSIEAEITQRAESGLSELLIGFEEHGRYIDMKRLQPGEGGTDYILGLMAWIRDKGLSDKLSQAYVKRRKLKTIPASVINYIAWGIAVKRNNGKSRRRSPWYNKPKSAAINDLFNEVVAGLPDIVGDEISKTLKQK